MRTNYIAVMAVLLSSAFTTLSAQDNPIPNREIPDARDYADLLPKGLESSKARPRGAESKSLVERPSQPRKKIQYRLPSIQPTFKPTVEGRLSTEEIEDILSRAQRRLEEVGEDLPEAEKAAQGGFDEAIGIIDQVLKELRASKKSQDAKKESTVGKAIEDPNGEIAGVAPPVSAKVKSAPSPSKEREAEQKAIEESNDPIHPAPKADSEVTAGELRLFKAVLLRRWAAQLRALADQMVKEADNLGSTSN